MSGKTARYPAAAVCAQSFNPLGPCPTNPPSVWGLTTTKEYNDLLSINVVCNPPGAPTITCYLPYAETRAPFWKISSTGDVACIYSIIPTECRTCGQSMASNPFNGSNRCRVISYCVAKQIIRHQFTSSIVTIFFEAMTALLLVPTGLRTDGGRSRPPNLPVPSEPVQR